MIKKEISDDSYFVVRGYMINELKLKKSELLVYAIVNSFTEKGKSYNGSLSYLASWINASKTTANNMLKSLTEKGLLNKTEKIVNNVKFCEYTANRTPKKREDEGCSKNNDGIPKIDIPCQKQNGMQETDTEKHKNFCDGISEIGTDSQNFEQGYTKNCTGGIPISDTGCTKNLHGGIPISDTNKELNTFNNIKFNKESEKESNNQSNNVSSISIYKDYDSTIVYYNVEYIERNILPEDFKKALRAGAEKAIDDNPLGYLVGVNPREAFPESLIYFCEEYYRHCGEIPEVPTDKEFAWLVQRYYMKDVTGNILFEDCAYYFSDYKEMIDRYFRTDYGKAKKDLKHFMSDGIREPFYTEMREAEKAEFERKCGNKPDTRNIPLFIPDDEEEEDDNLPF